MRRPGQSKVEVVYHLVLQVDPPHWRVSLPLGEAGDYIAAAAPLQENQQQVDLTKLPGRFNESRERGIGSY